MIKGVCHSCGEIRLLNIRAWLLTNMAKHENNKQKIANTKTPLNEF